MDLNVINSSLSYFYKWANAKKDDEIFALLDRQMESVTREFFKEIIGNQKFFSWLHFHYYFKDSKEYMSIMAIVGESMIKSAKAKLICFEDKIKFESYIFKSMKGKANMRMKEGNGVTDTLAERVQSTSEKIKKKMLQDKRILNEEEILKELDSGNVTLINGGSDIDDSIDSDDEMVIFDFDENDTAVDIGFNPIDNIGDPSEIERQELNTLRTDLSFFNNTVASLLVSIYKDLFEEDTILEKKIIWQIGLNYEGLRNEKIRLFDDPILIAHDITTIVRYEHWQNWDRITTIV